MASIKFGKVCLLLLLASLLLTSAVAAQKWAVGIKSGFTFPKLSVDYERSVGNESRMPGIVPEQGLFGELALGKRLHIVTELGFRKKEGHLEIAWKNPSDPFQPDLLRDATGDLKLHHFFVGVLPQYRLGFGKRYFGYVQSGLFWNRTVFEEYPCCVSNRYYIGENPSFFEFSMGGGIGIQVREAFSFSLDAQSVKLLEKATPWPGRPVLNFSRTFWVALRLGFFIG